MMPTETTDNKVFHDGIGRAAQQKGVAGGSNNDIIPVDAAALYRSLDLTRQHLVTEADGLLESRRRILKRVSEIEAAMKKLAA